MSDLLREIEYSLREERLEQFWKKYGNGLIAAILSCIVFTACLSAYRSWDLGHRTKQTALLMDVLDSPDFPANIETAALDLRPALQSLALFTAAGRYKAENKNAEALNAYTQIASDENAPEEFRDLALILQTRLEAGSPHQDPALLIKRLETVAQNKNSPWAAYTRLDIASLYASEMQDPSRAQEHVNLVLAMKNLPDTVYERARDLAHIYALQKQPQSSDKAPDSSGTDNGS